MNKLEMREKRVEGLKTETIKIIENDPVIKEIYSVFDDENFMTKTLPAIWKDWDVRQNPGCMGEALKMRSKVRIPFHIKVESPLYQKHFLDAQTNIDEYDPKRLAANYKESLTLEPIHWAINWKYSGGPSSDHPWTPLTIARAKVWNERLHNRFYGSSGTGVITLETPDYAEKKYLMKIVVGYNYKSDGFGMAVMENSSRTMGEDKIKMFNSFEDAKAFFALPYEKQNWGGMIWNDYVRLLFKIGIYPGMITDPVVWHRFYGWGAAG